MMGPVHPAARALFLESIRAAERAWRNVERREQMITQQVEHEVSTQRERFQHVRTEEHIQGVIAKRVDSDPTVKGYIGEYDRRVNTAVMYGIAHMLNLMEQPEHTTPEEVA